MKLGFKIKWDRNRLGRASGYMGWIIRIEKTEIIDKL